MLRQQLCCILDGFLPHTGYRSHLVQVQAGKIGLVGDLNGVNQKRRLARGDLLAVQATSGPDVEHRCTVLLLNRTCICQEKNDKRRLWQRKGGEGISGLLAVLPLVVYHISLSESPESALFDALELLCSCEFHHIVGATVQNVSNLFRSEQWPIVSHPVSPSQQDCVFYKGTSVYHKKAVPVKKTLDCVVSS